MTAKFSIVSLLILVALSALVLLSVRTGQQIVVLQSLVSELEESSESIHRESAIAKAKYKLGKQVLASPLDHNMPEAEQNFRELQQRRLTEPIQILSQTTILSIPTVSELRKPANRHFRFRVHVPDGEKVALYGEVADKDNRILKNTKLFRPASLVHELPSGESVIEVRIEQSAGAGADFQFGKRGVHRFHVNVMSIENALEGPPSFSWVTTHQEKDAPSLKATVIDGQRKLSRSSSGTRLFYALHMKNGRSAERFQLLLKQIKSQSLELERGQ